MQTLKPIGLETQIMDAIEGVSEKDKNSLTEKIEFLKLNLNKIKKINGTIVFHSIIDGNDIRYELLENPFSELVKHYGDNGYRKYYYPIKYAEIELTPVSQ